MAAVTGSASPVISQRRGPLAVLTLNRPHAANALNGAVLGDLHDAVAEISADTSVRVVLVTGAGLALLGRRGPA